MLFVMIYKFKLMKKPPNSTKWAAFSLKGQLYINLQGRFLILNFIPDYIIELNMFNKFKKVKTYDLHLNKIGRAHV